MNSPIDKLLPKLDKVKVINSAKDNLNHWQALCPSHGDKTPSLVITELLDGTVLIKCWSGCTAQEILQSVGLELKDLFKPVNNHKPYKRQPSKQAVAHERLIIEVAQAQINKGQKLTDQDLARYQLAVTRIKGLAK